MSWSDYNSIHSLPLVKALINALSERWEFAGTVFRLESPKELSSISTSVLISIDSQLTSIIPCYLELAYNESTEEYEPVEPLAAWTLESIYEFIDADRILIDQAILSPVMYRKWFEQVKQIINLLLYMSIDIDSLIATYYDCDSLSETVYGDSRDDEYGEYYIGVTPPSSSMQTYILDALNALRYGNVRSAGTPTLKAGASNFIGHDNHATSLTEPDGTDAGVWYRIWGEGGYNKSTASLTRNTTPLPAHYSSVSLPVKFVIDMYKEDYSPEFTRVFELYPVAYWLTDTSYVSYGATPVYITLADEETLNIEMDSNPDDLNFIINWDYNRTFLAYWMDAYKIRVDASSNRLYMRWRARLSDNYTDIPIKGDFEYITGA